MAGETASTPFFLVFVLFLLSVKYYYPSQLGVCKDKMKKKIRLADPVFSKHLVVRTFFVIFGQLGHKFKVHLLCGNFYTEAIEKAMLSYVSKKQILRP